MAEQAPSMDVEGAATDALYEDDAGSAKLTNMRVEPLELQWQRIGCSYRAATGTKIVLQDVYGRASPGEMQVGMGADLTVFWDAVLMLHGVKSEASRSKLS
jgi:hypothetical protein